MQPTLPQEFDPQEIHPFLTLIQERTGMRVEPRQYALVARGLGAASELSSKGVNIRMYTRMRGYPFRLVYPIKVNDSAPVVPFPIPLKIPAMTDIEVRAQAILAGGDVACSFMGWYE